MRLMRQHRAVDDIADGINAGHAGLPVVVDRNAALVGQLHARFVEIEARGEGLAAHGDEDDLGLIGDLRFALDAP